MFYFEANKLSFTVITDIFLNKSAVISLDVAEQLIYLVRHQSVFT